MRMHAMHCRWNREFQAGICLYFLRKQIGEIRFKPDMKILFFGKNKILSFKIMGLYYFFKKY